MNKTIFNHISCGQTLPPKNIHAVSVSIPTLQDVIDYKKQEPKICKKIKSAYPRFIIHPYLKIIAKYIAHKYRVSKSYEVVLLSSKKAVKLVSNKYFIHNNIQIDEPFGVILVQKKSCQKDKVLKFIQHVGCNLSSRFAEDYLYNIGILKTKHQEELEDKKIAEDIVKKELATAYNQPIKNIALAPSGMNAIYSVVRGLRSIQRRNNRNILVQFGWLYLDTMNIVEHHYDRTKIFTDITRIDLLEKYLKIYGFNVTAIITEVPTNPLLKTADLIRLRELCDKYNIPLIIDSTLATPYNVELKRYADICVESLTKFACGKADVLMGAVILNENYKVSYMNIELFKNCDTIYIKDIQRLAIEIKEYKQRVKKISSNTQALVEYFKSCSYIDKIFYCMDKQNRDNYSKIVLDKDSYTGLISVTFNKDFASILDKLNFAKGPSLGTEFTLLMPYTYLAHYDLIVSKKGNEFLDKIGLPIDLLRISVGIEPIEEIIKEFKRVEALI